MSKKIIAVSLALFLIVTCFVACGKKEYDTTKINGKEFILYTNPEGNTVISEDNRVAVAVTDANGELVTNKDDKEPQTNWVQLYGDVQGGTFIRGEDYQMNALADWTPGTLGRIFKNGTDEKCYVQFVEIAEITKDVTLATYLGAIDKQNKELVDGIGKTENSFAVEKDDRKITDKEIECKFYKYEMKDKDGKLIHYAENYYFATSESIYKVAYICQDGIGYDENFKFEAYLNTSFTFNG